MTFRDLTDRDVLLDRCPCGAKIVLGVAKHISWKRHGDSAVTTFECHRCKRLLERSEALVGQERTKS